MQETSATEVCESPSSPSKLKSPSGQRDSNSVGVLSRHARKTSATVVHMSFTAPGFGSSSIHSKFLARCLIDRKGHVSFTAPGFGSSSIHSKFLAHCLINRKGRAPRWRARPWVEGAPLGGGRTPRWRARPWEEGAPKVA
jgi:hypothetical protein